LQLEYQYDLVTRQLANVCRGEYLTNQATSYRNAIGIGRIRGVADIRQIRQVNIFNVGIIHRGLADVGTAS
jgi:hypothetical protein